jgi:hypothetical protein
VAWIRRRSQCEFILQVVPAADTLASIFFGIDTGCSTAPTTPCTPDNGGVYETPPLHQQVGRYPDFNAAFTSSGPCGIPSGSTSCGGGAYLPYSQGYPVRVDFGKLDNYGGTPTATGLGVYGYGVAAYLNSFNPAATNNADWVQAVENAINGDYVPYASQIYWVRFELGMERRELLLDSVALLDAAPSRWKWASGGHGDWLHLRDDVHLNIRLGHRHC